MSDKYIIKNVYFRLTFSDAKLLYPTISTFVFVGLNLSEEDAEDTYYFQFIDSFTSSGSAAESNPEGDFRVTSLVKDDLPEMLTLEELHLNLKACEDKRLTSAE